MEFERTTSNEPEWNGSRKLLDRYFVSPLLKIEIRNNRIKIQGETFFVVHNEQGEDVTEQFLEEVKQGLKNEALCIQSIAAADYTYPMFAMERIVLPLPDSRIFHRSFEGV